MGTAGLSIGRPASGTGFDMSATVAEIVGNLTGYNENTNG
jgi:hypothetical protein